MSCPYQLSQHRLVGHHFFETTGMWRISQVMLLIDFLLDGGADAKVFGFHTSQEHARTCENMREYATCQRGDSRAKYLIS